MNYWRMQLHPSTSQESVRRASESLAAGLIGLDFHEDPGDLEEADASDLPDGQRDYSDFANIMEPGDLVLVIAHHFPFALARVSGPYNHIKYESDQLRVWFRHFREVDQVAYYGDYVTNAREWQNLTMTDAISILTDPSSKSRQLIEKWIADLSW